MKPKYLKFERDQNAAENLLIDNNESAKLQTFMIADEIFQSFCQKLFQIGM